MVFAEKNLEVEKEIPY